MLLKPILCQAQASDAGSSKAALIAGKLNESRLGLTFTVENGQVVAPLTSTQIANLANALGKARETLERSTGNIDFDVNDRQQLVINNLRVLVPQDVDNFSNMRNGHAPAFKVALDTGDAAKLVEAYRQRSGIGAPAASDGAGGSGQQATSPNPRPAAARISGLLSKLSPGKKNEDSPADTPKPDESKSVSPQDPTVKALNNARTGITFERVDGKVLARLTPEEATAIGTSISRLNESQRKEIFGSSQMGVNDAGQLEFKNADSLANSLAGIGLLRFIAGTNDGKLKTFIESAIAGLAHK